MEKAILLVDDLALVRLPLAIRLEQAGYLVTEASNGIEALKMAAEKDFSIVITDLNMPEMGGLELTSRLRSMPAHRNVPVIMNSSESGKEWVRKGEIAGANVCMDKSLLDEITDIVRQFTGELDIHHVTGVQHDHEVVEPMA